MSCFTKFRKPFEKIAVFYGWPSAVNGATDLVQAGLVFAHFDYVVFGADLETREHVAHDSTKEIIRACRTTQFAGYVALTKNAIESGKFDDRVRSWKEMGVQWIFIDTFGHDYGNSGYDQIMAINAVRGNRLRAIVNAWDPDDVPWTWLTADDAYFLESFNPEMQQSKLDKLSDARRNGVKLFAITMDKSTPAPKRGVVDAFGWAEPGYSDENNRIDLDKNV